MNSVEKSCMYAQRDEDFVLKQETMKLYNEIIQWNYTMECDQPGLRNQKSYTSKCE